MSGPPAVTAFAPASVGNVGPGLDIVGLAVEGPGDEVRAEWIEASGVRILDPGHAELPREAERHASGLAALAVLRRAGVTSGERGIGLRVRKGLPLSGGQGGIPADEVILHPTWSPPGGIVLWLIVVAAGTAVTAFAAIAATGGRGDEDAEATLSDDASTRESDGSVAR